MNKKKPIEVENSNNRSVNNFFLVKKLKKQLERANEMIENLREVSLKKGDHIRNLSEEIKRMKREERIEKRGYISDSGSSSNSFKLLKAASTWDTGIGGLIIGD